MGPPPLRMSVLKNIFHSTNQHPKISGQYLPLFLRIAFGLRQNCFQAIQRGGGPKLAYDQLPPRIIGYARNSNILWYKWWPKGLGWGKRPIHLMSDHEQCNRNISERSETVRSYPMTIQNAEVLRWACYVTYGQSMYIMVCDREIVQLWGREFHTTSRRTIDVSSSHQIHLQCRRACRPIRNKYVTKVGIHSRTIRES